jgi:hypothetical protein
MEDEDRASMDLKGFVQRALCDIIEGVAVAQAAKAGSGAVIAPPDLFAEYGDLTERIKAGTGTVQRVEFDLVLDETSGKSGKGGIGVWLGSVGLGAQKQTEVTASSRSRLRFSVPIVLPRQV